MNGDQLEALHQRLLQHKRSVEEDIANLKEEIEGFNDESRMDFAAANHPADKAGDYFERERHLAIIDNLYSTLTLIDQAIKRVEKGTYGLCEVCGRPIKQERLEALPYAATCVNCKAERQATLP